MSNVTGKLAERRDESRQAEAEVESLLKRTLRQTVKGNLGVAARLRRLTIRRARRAISRRPSCRLYILLGDAYLNQPKSEACYREALRLDPCNSEALYELAAIEFWINKDNKTAARLLDRIGSSPAPGLEYQTYSLLAQVCQALGRKDRVPTVNRKVAYWRSRLPKQPIRELDPDWDTPDPLESVCGEQSQRKAKVQHKHQVRSRRKPRRSK